MKRIMVLLAVTSLVLPALGDVLGNPYDGVETSVSIAQDFVYPGTEQFTTWVVSDFETTVDYYLYDVVSEGRTTSTSGRDGDGANYDVWNGLPWDGGSIVLSASNGYELFGSDTIMGADFGGQMLPAGNYYMVFQAVRDFLMTGGNSLVYRTSTGNDNDWEWNPLLGQGWGSDHRPVESGGYCLDVNWVLNATAVPEPASLMLIALGGLLLRRR